MYGLLSMIVFLILVNCLSALIVVQMLRPDIPATQTVNFLNMFNAFLGVYQVFSSENWTNVLYAAMQVELPLGQAVIIALYITVWLFFANCTPRCRPRLASSLTRCSHHASDVHRCHQREL
jgi:hypothetical protein